MKLYFADILGRDPSKYEWDASGLSKEALRFGLDNELCQSPYVGVPHIAVSFPHVTAVYRWGDPRVEGERETNIHRVGLGRTLELGNISLIPPSAQFEIGCPAELYIVKKEIVFRAAAQSFDEYLNRFVSNGEGIANANLFREELIK